MSFSAERNHYYAHLAAYKTNRKSISALFLATKTSLVVAYIQKRREAVASMSVC